MDPPGGYNAAVKLPRWLMIGLWTTIVLAVLAAAGWFGWWWVTWPERTAEAFVSFVAAERFEEAAHITRLDTPDHQSALKTLEAISPLARQATLQAHSRTWSDMFKARQEFQVLGVATLITVERGTVTEVDNYFDPEVLQAVLDFLKTAGPAVTRQDVANAIAGPRGIRRSQPLRKTTGTPDP